MIESTSGGTLKKTSISQTYTILMANDDKSFCFLMEEALADISLPVNLYCVENGEELLNYLYRRGAYEMPSNSPRPNLILLDLNMPKLNGLDALEVINSDPQLRLFPIVMLSSSYQEEDVNKSYTIGANSFIVRPLMFDELVNAMENLCNYWFKVNLLPQNLE